MLCKQRLHLYGQRLHLIVRLSREEIAHDGHDAVKETVIIVTLLAPVDSDGIVECRWFWIAEYLLQFLLLPPDALNDSFLVVLHPDNAKGDCIVWRIIREHKRVLGSVISRHGRAFKQA